MQYHKYHSTRVILFKWSSLELLVYLCNLIITSKLGLTYVIRHIRCRAGSDVFDARGEPTKICPLINQKKNDDLLGVWNLVN